MSRLLKNIISPADPEFAEGENESHETLSDQILGLILLLVVSNWISHFI